jgi:metal-responsive CopG/Arc/MetJ family transcriptional regulator
MTVKNLVRITVSVEPKVLERLEEAQQKIGIFSRPEMYRLVFKHGLDKIEKIAGD